MMPKRFGILCLTNPFADVQCRCSERKYGGSIAKRRAPTQIQNAAQSAERFLTAATAWFAMCTWHIVEGPRQKFGSCGM
jgi:hypothetical protein